MSVLDLSSSVALMVVTKVPPGTF